MKTRKPRIHVIRSDEQRKALTSAMRLEILGAFVEGRPLSVADIAERMGRPPAAIHYHVKLLLRVGLLKQQGSRRSGKRNQALYLPIAEMFKMEQEALKSSKASASAGMKAISSAFRMAERDFEAAIQSESTQSEGRYRNCLATRMHCRLSKAEHAELNRHLKSLETFLMKVHRTHVPAEDDRFLSLTLALLPLKNREVQS